MGGLLYISGLIKILFSSSRLLGILISVELMNLAMISLSWQSNWSLTMWLLLMSVVHSVIGLVMLMLMIRNFGNDKSLNMF